MQGPEDGTVAAIVPVQGKLQDASKEQLLSLLKRSTQKLKTTEQESKELIRQRDEYKAQLEKLSSQETASRSGGLLQQEYDALSQDLEQARSELLDTCARLNVAAAKNSELSTRVDELSSLLEIARASQFDRGKERAALQKERDDISRHCEELKVALNQKNKGDAEAAVAASEAVAKEFEEMSQEIRRLQQELTKCKESEEVALGNAQVAASASISSIVNHDECQSQLSEAQASFEKQFAEVRESYDQEMKHIVSARDDLQVLLQTKERECTQFFEQLAALQNQLDAEVAAREDKVSNQFSPETERLLSEERDSLQTSLKSTVEKHLEELASLNAQIQSLSDTNLSLQEQKPIQNTENTEDHILEKSLIELKKTQQLLEAATMELSTLQAKLTDAENVISQNQAQASIAFDELKKELQTQVAETERAQRQLKHSIEEREGAQGYMVVSRDLNQQLTDAVNTEDEKLLMEISALKKQLEEQIAASEQHMAARDSVQSQLDELQKQHQTDVVNAERTQRQLKNAIEEREGLQGHLEVSRDLQQQQIDAITQERDKLQKRIRKLASKHQAENESAAQRLQDLQSQLDNAISESRLFQSRVKQASDEENGSQQSQVTERLSELQKQHQLLIEERDDLHSQLDSLQSEISLLRSQNRNITVGETSQSEKQLQQALDGNRELQAQLLSLTLERNELESRLSATAAVDALPANTSIMNEQHSLQIEDLMAQCNSLQSQLEQAQAEAVQALKAVPASGDQEARQAEILNLETMVENLRTASNKLARDLQAKELEVDRLSRDVTRAALMNDDELRGLIEIKNEASSEKLEIEDLNENVAELTFAKTAKDIAARTALQELTDKLESANQSISKYKVVSSKLHAKVKKLEEMKEATDAKLNELTHYSTPLQAKLLEVTTRFGAQKAHYNTIISSLLPIQRLLKLELAETEAPVSESSDADVKADQEPVAPRESEFVLTLCDPNSSELPDLGIVADQFMAIGDELQIRMQKLRDLEQKELQLRNKWEILSKEHQELKDRSVSLNAENVELKKQNSSLDEKANKTKTLLLRANKLYEDAKRRVVLYKTKLETNQANLRAVTTCHEQRWACTFVVSPVTLHVPSGVPASSPTSSSSSVAAPEEKELEVNVVDPQESYMGVDADLCNVIARIQLNGIVWLLLGVRKNQEANNPTEEDDYEARASRLQSAPSIQFWTTQAVFLERRQKTPGRPDLRTEKQRAASVAEVMLQGGCILPEDLVERVGRETRERMAGEWKSTSAHYQRTIQDLTSRLETAESDVKTAREEYVRYKARAHSVLQAQTSELDKGTAEAASLLSLKPAMTLLQAKYDELLSQQPDPKELQKLQHEVDQLQQDKLALEIDLRLSEEELKLAVSTAEKRLETVRTDMQAQLEAAQEKLQRAEESRRHEEEQRMGLAAKLRALKERHASSSSSSSSSLSSSPSPISVATSSLTPSASSLAVSPADAQSPHTSVSSLPISLSEVGSVGSAMFLSSNLADFSPSYLPIGSTSHASSTLSTHLDAMSPVAVARTSSKEEGGGSILHLAALQASRDEELQRQRAHIRQLQQLLSEKDMSLVAQREKEDALAKHVSKLERENLRDQQLQENMTYLKNVILQYMGTPTDHQKLFPVIAQLLQFSPQEVMRINKKRETTSGKIFGGWM